MDAEQEVWSLRVYRRNVNGHDSYVALLDGKKVPNDVVYYVLDRTRSFVGGSVRWLHGFTPVSLYAEFEIRDAVSEIPF